MSSAENMRINQKLKKKLNEKYHNRKDISFELTDEFRYDLAQVGKTCSFSRETPIKSSLGNRRNPEN